MDSSDGGGTVIMGEEIEEEEEKELGDENVEEQMSMRCQSEDIAEKSESSSFYNCASNGNDPQYSTTSSHQNRKTVHHKNKAIRDILISQIISRSASGKELCEDLSGLFKDLNFEDTRTASMSKRFSSNISEHNVTRDPGTMKNAFSALAVFFQISSENFSDLASTMSQGTMEKLNFLIQTQEACVKEARNTAFKAKRELNAGVQAVDAAYEAFQKALFDSSSGIPKEDPCAMGLAYKKALVQWKETEFNFSNSIQYLLKSMEDSDKECTLALKSILKEAIEARIACLKSITLNLQKTHAAVDAITTDDCAIFEALLQSRVAERSQTPVLAAAAMLDFADKDINSLVSRCKLLPPLIDGFQSALEPLHVEVAYDHTKDILKEGLLKRKSTVLKQWKTSFVRLSRFGFLSCFDDKDDGELDVSIQLLKFNVESRPSFQFDLVVDKKKGFSISERYSFQAETENEMIDWICALKDIPQKE